MTEPEYKFLRVKKETAERLRKHGISGESVDDILNKIMDKVNKIWSMQN